MVGKQIRQARERQNMKLSALAYEIDVSPSTLYRIETNQINITVQKLHKIASTLKVSLIDLIDEKYLKTDGEKASADTLENRYIQYLKHQNELLQQNLEKLQAGTSQLLSICSNQDNNIKALLAYMNDHERRATKGKRKKKPRI